MKYELPARARSPCRSNARETRSFRAIFPENWTLALALFKDARRAALDSPPLFGYAANRPLLPTGVRGRKCPIMPTENQTRARAQAPRIFGICRAEIPLKSRSASVARPTRARLSAFALFRCDAIAARNWSSLSALVDAVAGSIDPANGEVFRLRKPMHRDAATAAVARLRRARTRRGGIVNAESSGAPLEIIVSRPRVKVSSSRGASRGGTARPDGRARGRTLAIPTPPSPCGTG